jgi:hypothetical protein
VDFVFTVLLWLYIPLLAIGCFFSLLIYTQSVGPHGQGISPSQGLYLNTEQHKHRINAHTDIHALNGIRTHDPSVRADERCSCVRPHCHYDRCLCLLHKVKQKLTGMRVMPVIIIICSICPQKTKETQRERNKKLMETV